MKRVAPLDLATALHRELLRELARGSKARASLLADEDAESLHRLRVALRRLRALARLSRPFLRRPKGITEGAFREVGRILAPLRDVDVTLDALRGAATRGSAEEREELGAALDRLFTRRAKELRRVRKGLRGRAAVRLFAALTSWGERQRGTSAGAAPARRGGRALARGIAERLLADPTWGRHLKDRGPDPQHHRLRRRVRRARYQLEGVAALLGVEAPRTLGWLVEVQDALGRVQDVDAVDSVLERTGKGRAAIDTAALADWGRRQRGRGAKEWERLRAGRVAWKRGVGREFA